MAAEPLDDQLQHNVNVLEETQSRLGDLVIIAGRVEFERDAAVRRVAELEAREQARTDHGYVPGCPCPGCDPRGAAKRIAELEAVLRRVLDNVLIPGRGGAITPEDYNAARAVLDRGSATESAGEGEVSR